VVEVHCSGGDDRKGNCDRESAAALKIARSGHWSLEALGMSCGRVSSWELILGCDRQNYEVINHRGYIK
jgi:hypothetical protein